MIQDNFGFIKNINADVYSKLHNAEKKARTDFRSSGREIREALEKMIERILWSSDVRADKPELVEKIKLLQDKKLLPDIGRIKYKMENGEEASTDYYAFMRRYGNRCSHANYQPRDLKISFDNTIKCLKGFHLFLRAYYKGRIANSIPEFDKNAMPIEEYHVYKSYPPSDQARSKCEREFLAYTLDADGEKDFYAVLRLYHKADISDYFLQRNHKCFTVASKMSISSVPEGMTKMNELIPIASKQSSFYIICYIFNREPYELSDALLKEMSIKQRIKLCCRITNCMYNLHTLDAAIEHRMLNYESIFVCKFKEEWVPYVIKFDFAKIESTLVKFTVFDNALKAKDKLKNKKLSKYIAPEWEALDNIEKVDWAKVDIYSLGILFSDILIGRIAENPVPFEDLEELDVSQELIELLDVMRAEDPKSRFGIQDVKDIFDDEWRN